MADEQEQDEEECEECDLKEIPVGVTNEICKTSEGIDLTYCEQLFDKVIKEEISVDEYMDKVTEHVKDDPAAQHTLSELRKFYNDAKEKHGKE